MPVHYDYDDDDYDPIYDDGPRRHRPRMSTHYTTGGDGVFLNPGINSTRLHRSRSTGQRPSPYVINIHNDMEQTADARNYTRERSYSRGPRLSPQIPYVNVVGGVPNCVVPPPPQPVPQPIYVMPPPIGPNPTHHVHNHHGTHSRSRSRSNGHSPSRRDKEYFERMAQLEELKRREREEADRIARQNDIAEYERKKAQDEAELRDKIQAAERAEAEKRQKEKDARQESIRKWKEEEAERSKQRQAEIEKWQAEEAARKKKEKDAQDEAVRKWQADEEAKKKKAKEEQDEAVRKWKAEEDAKKEKQKKEEDEYKERVRKDLAKFGLRDNQIDAIVDHKEKKPPTEIGNQITIFNGRPTYPKVHRKHVAIETLKYYGLPWEYDRFDGDYIIILKEMSERETDILFEHTKRLKSRQVLMIDDRGRGDKPEYAWVRKRSKSRGKSPISNREKFAEFLIRR